VAAATAGKDELKQAAKRAREAKRKPREDSAAELNATQPQDTVESLRERVTALTAENTTLRRQVANLLDRLRTRGIAVDQAEDASAPF
jgi:predicted RNase H-like nuclease (RuvC/YqgF family)